jgi:pyruvate formate-lyase/glycerol dehydratase family glycyl radical enzyme
MNTLTVKKYDERLAEMKDKLIRTKSTVCTERAKIYTKIYKLYERKPIIIRRAIALNETLKEMSIFIDDNELLVGNQSSKLRAAPIFPEYAVNWIMKELNEFDKRPGDAFYLTEKDKHELEEISLLWNGKTMLDKGYSYFSEELNEIHESGMIRAEGNLTSGDAHIAVNFKKILKIGLNGYLEYVDQMSGMLDFTKVEDLKRKQFYDAVKLSLKGLQEYIKRYSELAKEILNQEISEERKVELNRISKICNNIAENPPKDFYEAIQLTLFIQLVLQIESNGHSVSLGRLDQYLYPFYKKDIDTKEISDEFASVLLKNLWCKLYSINKIRSWSHTRYSAGSPLYQNVTVGGQTENGKDAVNSLSYIILKSVGEMQLTQPNLSVRYHKNIDKNFIKECLKVIEKGFGMPAFNNDEIVIPSLLKLGVEKKDAYNYSAIGCIEIAVPGKWGYRCTGMSFLNFMRVFQAAMNDGKDLTSGKTFQKGIGCFKDFNSFDKVMKAWRKQVKFYAKATVMIDTAVDLAIEENVQDILCSAFVDDCIARGKTIKEGGSKYDFISGLQVGIANLGNSLAAIKKLVFEEKKITKEELVKVLENDFEGIEGEKIRLKLLNFAPKFGNDDDYVDDLLKEAYEYFIDEIEKYHTTRFGRGPIGCRYYAGTSSISANVPSGSVVGATPDGRKAGTPLAEGCSPTAGTDINGPTSVFKSVTKLPTNRITGGVLLNQKLSPATIKSEMNKEKLASMLETFFTDLKGWHVQYNIVDRETLLKAKENPEQYRNLVVRVAGYSAFFTVLSPDAQDDIITRTEHSL